MDRQPQMLLPRPIKPVPGHVVSPRRRPDEPTNEKGHLYSLIGPILHSLNPNGLGLSTQDEIHPQGPQTRQRAPGRQRPHQAIRFRPVQTHLNPAKETHRQPNEKITLKHPPFPQLKRQILQLIIPKIIPQEKH